MPNWCENDGTIKHKDVKKIKALYKAIQKNKFCEHVKPLPNGEWDYLHGRHQMVFITN